MNEQILVGTSQGLRTVGKDQRELIAGHEVNALEKAEDAWWAIVDGSEVWRSDVGESWTRIAALEALRANCLAPSPAGLLVGASESHLLLLRGGSLERVDAFEKVRGREEWHTPWGGPPDVRSMSTAPSGTVYVNVHVGGVVRTDDGGRSWTPTIEIGADVHQVLFDDGTGLLLAACAWGLAVSADRGQSWRYDTDGLHGGYLRAVAVVGETVLVTASTGPYTDRAAVYRRPVDSAGPFQRCVDGLPEWFSDNVDTLCLAAKGSHVAFGTLEGAVYSSTDEGSSWTVVAEGLAPCRCVAIG